MTKKSLKLMKSVEELILFRTISRSGTEWARDLVLLEERLRGKAPKLDPQLVEARFGFGDSKGCRCKPNRRIMVPCPVETRLRWGAAWPPGESRSCSVAEQMSLQESNAGAGIAARRVGRRQ